MELKPCPFCGSLKVSARRNISQVFVECDTCGMSGPWDKSVDGAVEKWSKLSASICRASIPEPAPKMEGLPVAESLLAMLHAMDWTTAIDGAIDLIRERDAFGRQKYGQSLMSQDGRNTIEDLRQEIGDAMMYAHKAELACVDVSDLVPLVRVLLRLMGVDPSPWRTGMPPESGRYLVTSGERWWVDSWGLTGQEWTNSRDSAVVAWMPVPKWEGER